MPTDALLISLALFAAAAFLWRRWRMGIEERATKRARLLEELPGLARIESKVILPSGFPRLEITVDGSRLILHPILDSLQMRKLPVLWLAITMLEKLPLRGKLDLMMRPSGSEVFSGFHELAQAIAPPPGFPEHCQLRGDGLEGLPPEELIARHLKPFADGRAKELLITPEGIRMVWLLAEAERANYLLFRDAEFEMESLPRDDLAHMLNCISALKEDILEWNSKALSA